MLLEYARGVAARANAYDMCGARKKQPGRQEGMEKWKKLSKMAEERSKSKRSGK
jgi:hypothetical protein